MASSPELTGQLLDVPKQLICPITQELMQDPVVMADGHSYESSAILAWLGRGNRTSPLTNEPLPHTTLVPNINLRILVKDLEEKMTKEQWTQLETQARNRDLEAIIDALCEGEVHVAMKMHDPSPPRQALQGAVSLGVPGLSASASAPSAASVGLADVHSRVEMERHVLSPPIQALQGTVSLGVPGSSASAPAAAAASMGQVQSVPRERGREALLGTDFLIKIRIGFFRCCRNFGVLDARDVARIQQASGGILSDRDVRSFNSIADEQLKCLLCTSNAEKILIFLLLVVFFISLYPLGDCYDYWHYKRYECYDIPNFVIWVSIAVLMFLIPVLCRCGCCCNRQRHLENTCRALGDHFQGHMVFEISYGAYRNSFCCNGGCGTYALIVAFQ